MGSTCFLYGDIVGLRCKGQRARFGFRQGLGFVTSDLRFRVLEVEGLGLTCFDYEHPLVSRFVVPARIIS